MRCDRCNRARRRRHVCWSRRVSDFCRSFRRRTHLRLNLDTYFVTGLLFLIRKKTCAQRQEAENLFHQLEYARHPERSIAKSKDPEGLPLSSRNGIPDFARDDRKFYGVDEGEAEA